MQRRMIGAILTQKDIDNAFDRLDRNTKGITYMLKDLDNVMGKISAAMRNKSATRQAMSDTQIRAFSAFQGFYESIRELRQELLCLSGDIGTGGMKNGINDDVDFDLLYKWLLNISKRQNDAIANISGILSAARDTLQLIA